MAALASLSFEDLKIAREIAVSLENTGERFFKQPARSTQEDMILAGKCDDHWIIQAIAAGVAAGRASKR